MSACTSAHRGDPSRPKRSPARKRWSADLSASTAVFLIALPLSLGIALACGAPLQAGLVAGAVGGLVCGRLGGAPLQVSGPAAGLTVITAELIQMYGWRTTCAITVAAGLAQIGLGCLRVARSALAVSPAIVHGMLTGIGITIALAQLHVMLGGDPDSSPVTNALELPGRLVAVQSAALSISGLTVVVLLAWPWLKERGGPLGAALGTMPAALAAVGLATAAAWLGDMRLPRVDLPSWRTHALPELPEGPVLGLGSAVLTLALVASIQALLSAVAADKLASARSGKDRVPRSDLDKELRGHGVGNVVSGMLGGLPITGVAVRSAANISAGAVSRNSAVLQGLWVLLAAGLLVGALELIPLASLGALVMVVGVQMVNLTHIRDVSRHREALAFWITTAAVVLLGVLEGVAIGIAVAVGVALHRLAHTRISVERGEAQAPTRTGAEEKAGEHRVVVRGQLTFLAAPRLSRALAQIPEGAKAVVELEGSFMDHAAYEALEGWRITHTAAGGEAEVWGRAGQHIAEPSDSDTCTPWTPWRNHQCSRAHAEGEGHGRHTPRKRQLLGGVRNFQRTTAPLVREELARLAKEGQQPSQLFLTCADSRLVTSMITSSGPGDLFTVRNVGNFVPLPGEEARDDSVAAAIEYAVDILKVESVTVCGHSGCGAMQALHSSTGQGDTGNSPLARWLRHGRPSLARLAAHGETAPRIADRETADDTEALCLANIVQQLEHLAAHECVARRVREGALELHGMYFHVGEAQAYVLDLDSTEVSPAVFAAVRPDPVAG
ncbi:SulP family inorganic anion transporter [Streptomyces sp. NBC_01187]|uniref:SulP family inorganic anion transporter n=1 Tax=Streptomyces sp. NBC_01187 TaxID=2903766 RepID=UPI00386F2DEB|nr:SulP family inorganic anion transporter [Streptomyces sp. NBC_01187]